MCADEPALLDAARPRRCQRSDRIALSVLPCQVTIDPFELAVSGVAADVGHKRCVCEAAAVLVNGQRMPALLNQRRRPHVVVQRETAANAGDREGIPSDRTDRVVDTEIGDLHAARPTNQQGLGGRERSDLLARHLSGRSRRKRFLLANEPRIPDQFGDASELDGWVWKEIGERTAVMLTRAADEAVSAPELVDGERRPAAQEPAGADETDERPRGECASAESEDVNLVRRCEGRLVLIILDQPVVGGADVRLETKAEAAPGDRVERSRADAFEVELQLCDPVVVHALVAALRGQREVVQNVCRIVAIVPGAIKADGQSPDLRHQNPLSSERRGLSRCTIALTHTDSGDYTAPRARARPHYKPAFKETARAAHQ